MTAEKKLADATGRIDAMETEMSALKNLLHVPGQDEPDGPSNTLSPSPTHKHHRHPSVKKVRISSVSINVNNVLLVQVLEKSGRLFHVQQRDLFAECAHVLILSLQ